MKKRILFIGNTNGLPGVQKDLLNYKSFFMGEKGGNWYAEEILTKMNPKLSDLKDELQKLKNSSLDFLIVIYSGHGGQKRETVLEINEKCEQISESELIGIATRQITIYDCCRAYELLEYSQRHDEFIKKAQRETPKLRELYERRIMQAIPQQLRLYACSIGETSSDTTDGGLYSKNLLIAAKSIDTNYMSVGKAHQIASYLTNRERKEQNPDSQLIRCLSNQELIISINPSLVNGFVK